MPGFILGSLVSQFVGAGLYWQVRSKQSSPNAPRWLAATVGALAYTLVASAIYIRFRVHIWLGGEGTSWGASVFIAVCMALAQAILFPGRPWLRQGPSNPNEPGRAA